MEELTVNQIYEKLKKLKYEDDESSQILVDLTYRANQKLPPSTEDEMRGIYTNAQGYNSNPKKLKPEFNRIKKAVLSLLTSNFKISVVSRASAKKKG